MSTRALVWESMLDADLAVRYWGALARSFARRERWGKIFLACTSSATVAGWVIWAKSPVAWKVLSGLSALIAIALPYLDYRGNADKMLELVRNYAQQLVKLEILWLRVDSTPEGQIIDELQKLRDSETQWATVVATLPQKREFVLRCQQEVRKARGL